MQFKRFFLTLASLMILLQFPLFSEEGGSSEEPVTSTEEPVTIDPEALPEGVPNPADFGFGFGLGAVTIGGVVYNTIRLNPEIEIGQFGIALDVDFRFSLSGDSGQTEFSVYEPDWYIEGGTFLDHLNLYLSKFDYIRWGHSGDDLFAKIGSIESATIGNGFIMGGYTNENYKPTTKYTGFRFELDTSLFNWPYMGIELFISNISALDLMAARYYVKPLGGVKSKVLSGMEIGLTFAIDRNPFYFMSDTDTTGVGAGYYDVADPMEVGYTPGSNLDPGGSLQEYYLLLTTSTVAETVMVYGIDIMQPLLDIKIFSMNIYGDFVLQGITAPTYGGYAGIGGTLVKFLTWNIGMTFRGDDFVPNYFDRTYDLNRAKNYILYTNDHTDPIHESGIDYKAALGTSFLDGGISFIAQVTGPFRVPSGTPETTPWEYPHLMALFSIAEGVIPYFDVSFWYDKQGIDSFAALVDPTNAIIGGRINLSLKGAVIGIQIDAKYDPSLSEDWTVTTTFETGIQF